MSLSAQRRLSLVAVTEPANESNVVQPCAAANGDGPSRLQMARLVAAVAARCRRDFEPSRSDKPTYGRNSAGNDVADETTTR